MTRALPSRRPRRTAGMRHPAGLRRPAPSGRHAGLRHLHLLPAMFAVALLGIACTTTPTSAPSPGPSPSPTVAPTGSSPTPHGGTATVRVYFFLGDFTGNGGLVPVEREAPVGREGATERSAIAALLAGPNATELGASPALYTMLPEGTRFLGLEIDGGIATIDLSGEFESGGGSASAKGRLAQVVYTLTQFPAITGVNFKLDGVPLTTFSDAGLDLRAPVDRAVYTDQLPAVFVDQPAWGAVLGNPAHLVGLSNAFEAVFHVRILDAGGRSLADGPVMATCGTGCWGTFDETVPYTVLAAAPGTLQVYELSAQDGSIINLTEYPVTLTP